MEELMVKMLEEVIRKMNDREEQLRILDLKNPNYKMILVKLNSNVEW